MPAFVVLAVAVLLAAAIPVAVVTPDGPSGLIQSRTLRILELLLSLMAVVGLVAHRPAPGNLRVQGSRTVVALGGLVVLVLFAIFSDGLRGAPRMAGPWPLDAAAILIAPLVAFGLVVVGRPTNTGTRLVRIVMDGVVIAGSTMIVTWYLLVRPLRDAQLAIELSAGGAMAFLVVDALAFALGLLVLARAASSTRRLVAVGTLGLALLLSSDLTRVVQFLPAYPPSSTLSELGWIAALCCFALAAWMAPDPSPRGVRRSPAAGQRATWLSLPYVFLVPVAAVLVVGGLRGDVDGVMIVGAAGIILVLGLRDVIALRENDELTGRLKSSLLQFAHRAEHDELTGLLNRRGLIGRLERMRRPTHRHYGRPVTLVFIDIDRFKGVNDTLGHAVGDEVLRAIGRRLGAMVRGWGASAVRFAGDEFVLLFPGLSAEAVALGRAQDALDLVERPIAISGRGEIIVTASAGVAISHEIDEGEAIVRHADLAMFAAKSSGRARVQLFEDDLRQRGREQMLIEQEMRRSLATPSQFDVHLQPLVRLADQRLWGAEALVRWRHPERGLLLPERFLGVAEESGMIVAIGEAVLRKACAAAAAVPGLVVSVNLSPRQLHDSGLVPMVRAHLDAHALMPQRLCLEVTEGALVDARSIEVLEVLQRLGVRISIDDFGVGASSFRQLRRLPNAQVKLDRSFVERVDHPSGADDRVMIKAMVTLAEQLGLQIVAEGIEREAQLAIVRELGVPLGQGWLLGAPERMASFVTARGGRPLVRRNVRMP